MALGCNDQTVRNGIRRFERDGLDACLTRQRPTPPPGPTKLDAAAAERLQALLHRSPRDFGHPTSLWTLGLTADVSFAEGLTRERVSDETIRRALHRLGVGWKRARHWITSPDPGYARNKGSATG